MTDAIKKKELQLYCQREIYDEPRCKHMLAELGTHHTSEWSNGERERIQVTYDYAPVLEKVFEAIHFDSPRNQAVGLNFDYYNRKLIVKIARNIVALDPSGGVKMSTFVKQDQLLLHVDTVTGMVGICDNLLVFDVVGDSIEMFTFDLFDTPPRIVCAANRYYDKELVVDQVILGARHMDRFMRAQIDNTDFEDYTRDEFVEGFIDQRGNFYDRRQAWYLAHINKQILKRVGGDTTDGGTLYSENLY